MRRALFTSLVVALGDVALVAALRLHPHAIAFWVLAAIAPHALALGLWSAAWSGRRRARAPHGGARISARGPITRARLPGHGPAAAALAMVGLTALLLALALGALTKLRPPAPLAAGALALVALLGAAELLRARAFLRTGAADLVVDASARTLTLPRATVGAAARTVAWSDVTAVTVDAVEARRRRPAAHVVALTLASARGTRLEVARWPERAGAEQFRAWLERAISRSG